MRLIHFDCLKAWIKEKCGRRVTEVPGMGSIVTWVWKNFECEICKAPYPLKFKHKRISYDLVDELVKADLPETGKPYLLMQSLPFEKSSGRVIHLLKPSGQLGLFKMGRGHESTVRICDISVSRVHCLIKFQRDDEGKYGFALEDNLSKFGTLVLPKREAIAVKAD